jgi:hypothetical protein
VAEFCTSQSLISVRIEKTVSIHFVKIAEMRSLESIGLRTVTELIEELRNIEIITIFGDE